MLCWSANGLPVRPWQKEKEKKKRKGTARVQAANREREKGTKTGKRVPVWPCGHPRWRVLSRCEFLFFFFSCFFHSLAFLPFFFLPARVAVYEFHTTSQCSILFDLIGSNKGQDSTLVVGRDQQSTSRGGHAYNHSPSFPFSFRHGGIWSARAEGVERPSKVGVETERL
jgi:hypothetical protein